MLFRILVGFDFSEASALVLRQAVFLADRLVASELHVLTALNDDMLRRGIVDQLTDKEAEALTMRLRAIVNDNVARSQSRDIRIVVHTPIGYAADELLRLASLVQADLIAVGTNGRSGLSRLIHRSTADVVARTACCPVFIARPKQYEPDDDVPKPERARADAPDPPYMEPHLYQAKNWAPVEPPEWPLP